MTRSIAWQINQTGVCSRNFAAYYPATSGAEW